MQKGVGRVSSLSKPSTSARKVATAQDPIPAPRLAETWHKTTEAFIASAAPLLALGVIGFAAVPFLTSAVALFSVPLARMVITQTVVQGNLRNMPWRRLPASLVMAGVYTAALIVGQIGIGVPLRAWGLNLNFAERKSASWEGAAQTLVMRSVNALTNTTALPFKDELRVWRNQAFDEWVQSNASYEQRLMTDYWQKGPDAVNGGGVAGIERQTQRQALSRPDLRLVFIGGAMMILVAETLLAFRSLMGAKPTRLLWLSLMRFGAVAGHLWVLRLVVVGLQALFVFMPIIVVDYYAYLARDWGWFGSEAQGYVLAICLALINAIVSTFEAVYGARLYLALTNPAANP